MSLLVFLEDLFFSNMTCYMRMRYGYLIKKSGARAIQNCLVMEPVGLSIDRWNVKACVIDVYNEILLSHQQVKSWFHKLMDKLEIIVSQTSQTQQHTFHILSILCRTSTKKFSLRKFQEVSWRERAYHEHMWQESRTGAIWG